MDEMLIQKKWRYVRNFRNVYADIQKKYRTKS